MGLEMLRVPLIPCVNRARNNQIDVCCRDPNYKDPWPDTNNNGNGGQQGGQGQGQQGGRGQGQQGGQGQGQQGGQGQGQKGGRNIGAASGQNGQNQQDPKKTKRRKNGYGR